MPAATCKIAPPANDDMADAILPDSLSRDHEAKVAQFHHFPDSHQTTPLLQIDHATRGHQMSFSHLSNEFDLRKRLADALRRRIFQDRVLTIKQLAYAIQASEQTIWNWLNGNSEPKSGHLMKLIMFFDEGFANELFNGTGAVIVKMNRNKPLIEAISRFHEALNDIQKFGEIA